MTDSNSVANRATSHAVSASLPSRATRLGARLLPDGAENAATLVERDFVGPEGWRQPAGCCAPGSETGSAFTERDETSIVGPHLEKVRPARES